MDFTQNMGTAEQVDVNVLGQQYNAIASVLAEAYLARKEKPSIKEMLSVIGQPYTEGKLYVGHIQALQRLLKEEYEVMGLDYVNEVNKHGEPFQIGKLTSYERQVLTNKLRNVVSYTNQVRLIQESHNKVA